MVQVEKWKKMRGRVKVFVKPVLIVFVIILLGMSAILRANFSYVDDLARTVEGYKGWGNFSRYLSNALAVVLFGNGALTDISPWPQIVAAFIMAVAGVSLLYIIYGRKKFRWWELFVVVILALNPYFLECLSYKFDAPFIATVVLMMIVPFLARGKKTEIYMLAVFGGTLATCMTYQAALGILPMVTIALVVRMWNQGEKWGKIWRFGLKTVGGYIAALLLFKIALMKKVDAYVVTELPGVGGLVPQIVENLGRYYRLVMGDFPKMWLGLILVIMAGFVVMMVMRSKQRKWLAGIVAVMTVALLGVMCFGIYAVMVKPLFVPRAMFGVMVMITIMAVVAVEDEKMTSRWQEGVKVFFAGAGVLLAYLFVVFGFTYGNALALQKNWTEFRVQEVIGDLEQEVNLLDTQRVMVVGRAGAAPAIETALETYPVLSRLVPEEFESGYWGQYQFFRYYGLEELNGDMFEVPNVEEYPIVRESWYHNIRRNAERGEVVVELKFEEN